MNAAVQVAFLCGLVVVLLAVAAFSTVVVRSASRNGRAAGLGVFGARRAEHSRLGRTAFLAHRLTGFGIFAFLCLHVLDVGLYSVSRRLYDAVQPLYGSAPLRVFECGLLFAVLFHTCNGLRLLALDLGRFSTRWTQRSLGLAVALTAGGGIAGSALILAPILR